MEQNILGLDLGTNSVAIAAVRVNYDKRQGEIIGLASRIIPQSSSGAKQLDSYKRGRSLTNSKNTVSECANRRGFRSQRKNGHRYKDRRNKLLVVLDFLGWKPLGLNYNIEKRSGYQKITILPKQALNHEDEKTKTQYDITKTDVYQQYELRWRGVHSILTSQELGTVLYHLNQRRGYQDIGLLGNEEEELPTKKLAKNQIQIKVLIRDCEPTNQWKNKRIIYSFIADSQVGEITGTTVIPYFEKYKGKEIEVIIEQDKEGSRTLMLFKPTEWAKSREQNNENLNGKTIGEKLFEELSNKTNDPLFRHWNLDNNIRKRVYDRKHYKDEFDKIWNAQLKKNPDFANLSQDQLLTIVQLICPKNNEKIKKELVEKGLKYILKEYIIYYQRPLKKGQKDLVSLCRFESNIKTQNNKGINYTRVFKCIPKSHPFYQEFRIWSAINNLQIKNIKGEEIYLDDSKYEKLYLLFNKKEEVTPEEVLRELTIVEEGAYTNFRKEAKLKGNATLAKIQKTLKRETADKISLVMQTQYGYNKLWHILYSIPQKSAKVKTLMHSSFKIEETNEVFGFYFSQETAEALANISLEKGYGGLSQRAITKILPLMKRQKWFKYEDIDKGTQLKVESILNSVDLDISLNDRLKNKLYTFTKKGDFQGLRFDEATELVYGSHTKVAIEASYDKPEDIKLLKQHSLRHPVVEEVVNETLRVVREAWNKYWPNGKPNAIHIELMRELQNSQKERERLYKQQIDSREKNSIVRDTLIERFNLPNPSIKQIERFKLWEEQKYHCPYTDSYINPEELFATTSDGEYFYDIDHIIPKRRLFDDSFSNKVLCKKGANLAKRAKLARTFMERERDYDGLISFEKFVHIIQKYPAAKRNKLLMKDEELPDDFIERQKKETQYITRRVIEELAKIVGSENVHTTTGGITSFLRREWCIDDIFKRASIDRYMKAESKLKEAGFAKLLVEYVGPDKKLKINEFSKRIDHRHHSLDALVVACTSPKHIKYINDLNKIYQNTGDRSLEEFATRISEKGKRKFNKPWESFCSDVENHLNNIGISFKQKWYYTEWREVKSQNVLAVKGELHSQQPLSWRYVPGKKIKLSQLFKQLEYYPIESREAYLSNLLPTAIHLKIIQTLKVCEWNLQKAGEILTKNPIVDNKGVKIETFPTKEKHIVTRKSLSNLIDKEIEEIRDDALKLDLTNHIKEFNNKIEDAFNAEGIVLFNLKRKEKGKTPVYKVQLIQKEIFNDFDSEQANKVIVRKNSFNNRAVFKTSSKTWSVIYERIEDGFKDNSCFKPVSLFDYTQAQLDKMDFVEKRDGYKHVLVDTHTLFYMPDPEEIAIDSSVASLSNCFHKIYRLARISGDEWYFLPHYSSEPLEFELKKPDGREVIVREFGKSVKDFENDLIHGRKIKIFGKPLEVDRLGNLKLKSWS